MERKKLTKSNWWPQRGPLARTGSSSSTASSGWRRRWARGRGVEIENTTLQRLSRIGSPYPGEFRQFRHPASGRACGNRGRRVLRDRVQAVRSDQTGRQGMQGMVAAKSPRRALRVARGPSSRRPAGRPPPVSSPPGLHAAVHVFELRVPAQARLRLVCDEGKAPAGPRRALAEIEGAMKAFRAWADIRLPRSSPLSGSPRRGLGCFPEGNHPKRIVSRITSQASADSPYPLVSVSSHETGPQ